MSSSVVSVRDLKKSYRRAPISSEKSVSWWRHLNPKSVQALKGVSFEIHRGAVTGFLGGNGAGKTTSIKCLLGLALPDSGEIEFFGGQKLSNDVKRRIGFLPERPYFYEYLTGREFLRFYGELSTDWPRARLNEKIDSLLKRVSLEHASDRPLRGYSKGMLQRVGIAQALVHEPEFIVLDEPMTGLDPDGRFEVREIIRETSKAGTAVFFSSHLLPDAEQLCDRLVILKQGELVYQGATRDLLERVEDGFELVTSKDGKESRIRVSNAEELQKAIDAERAARSWIMEVKPVRLTLEDAFVRIAMDRTGGGRGRGGESRS